MRRRDKSWCKSLRSTSAPQRFNVTQRPMMSDEGVMILENLIPKKKRVRPCWMHWKWATLITWCFFLNVLKWSWNTRWFRHLLGSLTPPKFNSSPLKNSGWKTILSYWVSVTFQGRLLLNFGGVTFTLKRLFSCCCPRWKRCWEILPKPRPNWVGSRKSLSRCEPFVHQRFELDGWNVGVEPKIMGVFPPNHPMFNRVFSIIFTIHLGGFPPIFGLTPM